MPNRMVNKGQTTSTATPWSEAAPHISNLMGSASDLYQGQMNAPPSPLLQSASSGLQDYASGANIDGGSPQFNSALNYQSGQLTDDINRGFSLAGRYGSGAHIGDLGDTVGNFRNQALQGEMSRQQGLQMQGISMAPGMAQAQQLEPWNVLNSANQIYGPYGQMFGTQTQTEMGPRGFPILRALGGIATSALGMMSDRRMKEDIRRVGATDQGVPVYTFRYRGSDATMLGVMADEAPADAVHEIDGIKYVDYSRVH